jgi:hypothetical protein
MKDYLKPENTGEKSGECPICGINLYGTTKTKVANLTTIGTPIVMPCNIRGEDLVVGQPIKKDTVVKKYHYNCPYEEPKEVESIDDFTLRLTGGNQGEQI